MAIDFELLKKEWEEAQKQKVSDFWVPDMGENLIRVLPPRDRKLFYRKVGVHYRLLGSGMEFCPKVCLDERCPVCETVEDLKRVGSPGAMELVRRFALTERFLMNVIVLSSDVKNIKQYLAPKTVRLELVKICLDPDYGDITDLETGRNVVIEKVQGGGGFVNYIVRVKPNPVPISTLIGKVLREEDIPSFDEIVRDRVKSYDELRYVLFGGDELSVESLVDKYVEDNRSGVVESRAVESGGGVKEEQIHLSVGQEKSDKVEVKGGFEDVGSIDSILAKAMEILKSQGHLK